MSVAEDKVVDIPIITPKPKLNIHSEEARRVIDTNCDLNDTLRVDNVTPLSNDRKKGKYFRILSIDGGGVRGIIPNMVLSYIEKRTGKKIHELFNLITGTSTGGLLGMILNIPKETEGKNNEGAVPDVYNTNDSMDLYLTQCPKIFESSISRRVKAMWGLAGPRYSSTTKRSIIQQYTKSLKISDCLTEILIPTFDVRDGTPYFFKSSLARASESCNYLMTDVLDATSAAPTYFKPVKVENMDSTKERGYKSFVDGALTANCPVLCALIEALKVYKVPREEILIVSLGCGEGDIGITNEEASCWGALNWAPYFPGALINGSMNTVGYQVDELLDEEQYWRFQSRIPAKNTNIDDASFQNLKWLQQCGKDLVLKNKDRLDLLCDMLVDGMDD